MINIIPLAGPDFFHPNYGIKPFIEVKGKPLIEKILKSRIWFKKKVVKNKDTVFVLNQSEQTTDAIIKLTTLFPGSHHIVLSSRTKGAVMSALCGASLSTKFDVPVIVDFVDIFYEINKVPLNIFYQKNSPDGIIPWFFSNKVAYSYLKIKGNLVVKTAEKEVISCHASAGTYFFKNLSIFLTAISGSLADKNFCKNLNSLFVCPVYNYLIKKGKKIIGQEVENVQDFSIKFHQSHNKK